ncbi:MAG: hypothetical protein ACRCSN_22100 [Dermatophilaceae bacterium]
MTTPQTPAPEPSAHDPHGALPGPDGRSARTARRTAGIAFAVLLLAAGGATAAYATGDQPAGTDSYGVVTTTDGSDTQDRTTDDPATGKGTAPDGSTSSERRDCPEKNGGGSGPGDGEQGTTPAPSPSTEAPAPDTSTL